MTEQEYIYVRDLSNVLTAGEALRKMLPKFSGVPEKEYQDVMLAIHCWQDHLFKKIKIKDPKT